MDDFQAPDVTTFSEACDQCNLFPGSLQTGFWLALYSSLFFIEFATLHGRLIRGRGREMPLPIFERL